MKTKFSITIVPKMTIIDNYSSVMRNIIIGRLSDYINNIVKIKTYKTFKYDTYATEKLKLYFEFEHLPKEKNKYRNLKGIIQTSIVDLCFVN